MVNHRDGFAVYNEQQKRWKNHTNYGSAPNSKNLSTRSAKVNSSNETCFLTANGIGTYKNNRFYHTSRFSGSKPTTALSAEFMVEWFGKEKWVFPFSSQDRIYKTVNGKIALVTNVNLLKALSGRTTTSARYLSDGSLWICTYTGIIRYNPTKDIATVYFPNFAFSDCFLDKEGNYWFSTLQSGLIRVPNLDFIVWNNFQNNQLIKLTTDGKQIYFATVNGDIGSLNLLSQRIQFLQQGTNSNVQTLTYSSVDKCAYFYTDKNLYSLCGESVQLTLAQAAPTKHFIKIKDQYLLCSSFGAVLMKLTKDSPIERLTEFWSREAKFSERNNSLWIATNNGLIKYKQVDGKWKQQCIFFKEKQILSIDLDEKTGELFAVTFEGKLYSIGRNHKPKLLHASNDDVQSYRVQHYNRKVYAATNRGVWIVDLKTRKFNELTIFSGLASNNVQDLVITNGTMWLATGKGLQKIPMNAFPKLPRIALFLNNKSFNKQNVYLSSGEKLVLFPETNAYSSCGNFQYAYRINGSADWTKLPGSIDQIQLQNIPSGNFRLELKAIDHLGQDSKNMIVLKGYSSPPFWFSWWFILTEILVFLALVFFFYKKQLAKRQKQFQYQQELNALKLTAIKSQMNPHFIFNVLSSIKGYIYENDRQRATAYLDDFSDLMRSVLEMSEVHYTTISDELKLLKLYIDLEGMMLEEFSCDIQIDENVNTNSISIPSLVLQPYVENAFKHGLRHKKGEKKLSIIVCKIDADHITIELRDNGIGRKAAEQLNTENAIKRQSFATQALEKRMALINREKEQQIQLEIIDLTDENGNNSGTSILLTLQHPSL